MKNWWKHVREEIPYHHNLAEVIDHTYNDNGKKSLYIEEEVDVTLINSINAANETSMKYYDHMIHKYYAPF